MGTWESKPPPSGQGLPRDLGSHFMQWVLGI